MKLEIVKGKKVVQVTENVDFKTAGVVVLQHAEKVRYSDRYDYILTDGNGKIYHIAAGAWEEM